MSIDSDDPDLKILAIKRDVSRRDETDLPRMVEELQNDDPAIRFYAIEALRCLAHEDFGYRYYETDEERAKPTARWQAWLKAQILPQK